MRGRRGRRRGGARGLGAGALPDGRVGAGLGRGVEPGRGFGFGGKDIGAEALFGGDEEAGFFRADEFGAGDEGDAKTGADDLGPAEHGPAAEGGAGGFEALDGGDVDEDFGKAVVPGAMEGGGDEVGELAGGHGAGGAICAAVACCLKVRNGLHKVLPRGPKVRGMWVAFVPAGGSIARREGRAQEGLRGGKSEICGGK